MKSQIWMRLDKPKSQSLLGPSLSGCDRICLVIEGGDSSEILTGCTGSFLR